VVRTRTAAGRVGPNRLRVSLRRPLPKGRATVELRALDAAGNLRVVRVRVRL